MLITTVISGMLLLMSQGHMTSLLPFIMVLVSVTENVSYFCQYINILQIFGSLLNSPLKYIIKVIR